MFFGLLPQLFTGLLFKTLLCYGDECIVDCLVGRQPPRQYIPNRSASLLGTTLLQWLSGINLRSDEPW